MAKYLTVLSSAARTTDQISQDIFNWESGKALHLVVDVTAGSPNLLVYVKGKDEISDKYYTIATSSTINGGTTIVKVGPGLTTGTNVVNDYIPAVFQVAVTQSGGVSATYSIGASLI